MDLISFVSESHHTRPMGGWGTISTRGATIWEQAASKHNALRETRSTSELCRPPPLVPLVKRQWAVYVHPDIVFLHLKFMYFKSLINACVECITFSDINIEEIYTMEVTLVTKCLFHK